MAAVLSPVGGLLGFVAPPPAFFAVLAVMVLTYLGVVEALKRRFYATSGWQTT